VLITRTPDGRLTFLQAMASRRKAALAAGLPAAFTGYLITDGYTGYQHLLASRLAGIQQCAAHVIRRCRAVTKLGPGGVQNWAGDIIAILRESHAAVEAARARGDTELGQQALDGLRERYDTAAAFGMTHNRLRDWHEGNHPGYALACWLRDYKEQVFLFTRSFSVSWTNDLASYCTSCGGWEVRGLAGRSGGCRADGFSVAGGSDILPWHAVAPGFAVGVAAA
jgi:hypothetical protein